MTSYTFELRGARGSIERARFDTGLDRDHIACLDGDQSIHNLWLERWNGLLWKWIDITDGGKLSDANAKEAVEVAETIYKVGPLLTTQSLFFGKVESGKEIAKSLIGIAGKHRAFADSVSSDASQNSVSPTYFGDANGVALFKGMRHEALCVRHECDGLGRLEVIHAPVERFVEIINYIQEQRSRFSAEIDRDILRLPELMRNPAEFRRAVTSYVRYRTYIATLHHDIARYLLKKHFFRTSLSADEKVVLKKHYDAYEDHAGTLPASFVKPVRYDTALRYALFNGEVLNPKIEYTNFCQRYTEATLADHGIILETRLVWQLHMKSQGLSFDQEEMWGRLDDLVTLSRDFSLNCFSENLSILQRRYNLFG